MPNDVSAGRAGQVGPGFGVLIVDDSESVRTLVKAVLDQDGVFGRFHEASDGEEALSLLDGGAEVDLVLMDMRMPGMDGFELISRMRGRPGLSDTPILVLSVEGRGEIKARGLSLGASDYVVKPFDQGELVARAKLLLRRKLVQDELRRKNRELAEINERLRRLAVTDELTGLSNRSQFFEKLEGEMKRCVRHGISMTLLMLDLDDFKGVNDTFGHVAGDEVLREVAGILQGCVRDSDAAARYGGEEFMAYLVHTDVEGARVAAERIRSAIEGRVFAFPEGTYRATASIGMAAYPGAGEGGDGGGRTEFIKRADAALYAAKRQGKNRVVADTELA